MQSRFKIRLTYEGFMDLGFWSIRPNSADVFPSLRLGIGKEPFPGVGAFFFEYSAADYIQKLNNLEFIIWHLCLSGMLTQCRLIFSYRRFGRPIGPIFKEQRFHLHGSVSLKSCCLVSHDLELRTGEHPSCSIKMLTAYALVFWQYQASWFSG